MKISTVVRPGLPGVRWISGRTLSSLGAVAVLAATAVVVHAAPAQAAEDQMQLYNFAAPEGHVKVYTFDNELWVEAQPGQTNRITISQSGDRGLVTDTGAPIYAAYGCRLLHPHQAVCDATQFDYIRVDTDDMDDTVEVNTGVPGRLRGGSGDDILTGGSGHDMLYGGPGNDTLTGRGGNDLISGGDGHDTIVASAFSDGADVVYGGAGIDSVSYAARVDPVVVSLDGNANDGAAGERDIIHPDVENIHGGAGDDVLIGSASNNFLRGNAGDDTLIGGVGDDQFSGGPGDDLIFGGVGDDTFYAEPDFGGVLDGADQFVGGPGVDTAHYGGRRARVFVSLDGWANDGAPGEGDNIREDVENVFGGSGDDILVGSAANNQLVGLAGADLLYGLGGGDVLDSRDRVAGNDRVEGGPGIDTCYTDTGDARVTCEAS